ncbi:MAG TPA: ABC transporter permease [Acidobacteriaceae bacterium]
MNWVRRLFSRRRLESDLDKELRFHFETQVSEKIRAGLSDSEARRRTRLEFGGIEQVKEDCRRSRGTLWLEYLVRDTRFGIRQLAGSPAFTSIALLSLALGIGANTAIFTLVNAILLRPLPVHNPGELVLFGDGMASGSTGGIPDGNTSLFSYSFFHDFQQQAKSYSGVVAIQSGQFSSKASFAGAAYETTHIGIVSGNYFSVLGVPAFLGRTIVEADDRAPGAGPVAVASYAWFLRHCKGDPSALGKVIRVESHDYTLVGVAPPGFNGTTVGQMADLWIPLSMEKELSPGRNGLENTLFQSLILFGRLKPGVSMVQANAETNVLFRQIVRGYLGPQPTQKHLDDVAHAHIDLTPGSRGVSQLRGAFSMPLMILMTIVGVVLLIACANIANMFLARGVARTREIAVRMALGAGRGRIVFQLLVESMLLSAAGAVAGIAMAWKASAVLLHMATPGPEPVPLNLTPDLPVLGFTVGLTVLTALLFGCLPAFRATGFEFTPALKDGRGSSSGSARGALARSLIVGQIALSVLLLVVAGLFVRSLIRLTSIDTGFDKHNVLVFSMDSSTANLTHHKPEEVQSVHLQEQIESRVESIPGVKSASFAFFTFNQGGWTDLVLFQGAPRTPENSRYVFFNNVGNGFFSTMGIPLVAGRGFSAQDTQTSPKVAVINESMAHRFFPNGSAIGRRFSLGETPEHPGEIEVIGVVKNAKYASLDEGSPMAAYFPCSQNVGFYGNFAVRYDEGANRQEIISRVRSAIAQTNPNILVNGIESLEDEVDNSIAAKALIARLSGFFGLVAVFLACIGIYGLLSYSVARRTCELGIRLALGAQSRTLLWLVLRECVPLLLFGLALGVPVALSSTRVLKSQLYELSPLDPMAISIAVVAVIVMTVAAAWLPARRAARINPIQALRTE